MKKVKSIISIVSALALSAMLMIPSYAAGTIDFDNGADIAGYVLDGAKAKMSITTAPAGTTKINWYFGIDSSNKELIRSVNGASDSFYMDIQNERGYVFAEALDNSGNVIASNDHSVRNTTKLAEDKAWFDISFDAAKDGKNYGWYGAQYVLDGPNANYVTNYMGGRIAVTYGNPELVSDPLGANGNVTKLSADFNYIENNGRTTGYNFDVDHGKIYIIESDMMFPNTQDRKLTKVTYQTASDAAKGSADGRDSVAITISNNNFEFYGNTMSVEANKWYHVAYVYDAINDQLTALIDNKYLGKAAGVEIEKLGRLSFVENNSSTMYIDNIKIAEYVPGILISADGRSVEATSNISTGDVSIWRSIDKYTYTKVSNNTSYTAEALPYTQYFVARVYDGEGYTQSQRIDVSATTATESVKNYYFNWDCATLPSLNYNDTSKVSIVNGKLSMTAGERTYYEMGESRADRKGLDSGIICFEFDTTQTDWRNDPIFETYYLYNIEGGWSCNNSLSLYTAGGNGNMYWRYTDANGTTQTVDSGYSWNNITHAIITIDVDNDTAVCTLNEASGYTTTKTLYLNDVQYVYRADFCAPTYAATFDNLQCYKLAEKEIKYTNGYTELSVNTADANNNIKNGTAIIGAVTTDGSLSEYMLFAVAYDANGRVLEVGKSKVNFEGANAKTFKVTLADVYEDNQIKIFSWKVADGSFAPVLDVNIVD